MSKSFRQLQSDLIELQDALDNESNSETRADIQAHIAEVKQLLENYDLSADDLFECECCHNVYDIEDSIKNDDDELVCALCI